VTARLIRGSQTVSYKEPTGESSALARYLEILALEVGTWSKPTSI